MEPKRRVILKDSKIDENGDIVYGFPPNTDPHLVPIVNEFRDQTISEILKSIIAENQQPGWYQSLDDISQRLLDQHLIHVLRVIKNRASAPEFPNLTVEVREPAGEPALVLPRMKGKDYGLN